MGLLGELTWANLIALLTVASGIAATWALNRHNRNTVAQDARASIAADWEAFCAKQQARIDQLTSQIERAEHRILALEEELEQTRTERDAEREKRMALERKVADMQREIDDLRRQGMRVRP